jgi:large subunit ribosomal protein L18e
MVMKINVERGDVKDWLTALSHASTEKNTPKLWKRVHSLLEVPTRRRAEVNIYKINKNTKEGDNVIVPGKVLSVGSMDHTVNITALEFSKSALDRLKSSNCKVVELKDMLNAKKVNIIV